ncbi:MAG TPA: helix-turn-helix transcriptional regulator [Candidatus Udaeobacter sp.]|nr:helix-turn-helix transcriptional regulator [Candidatus Udaeobacter sp.]
MSKSDQSGVKALLGSPELTPREVQVLFWICQGKGNHDIGIILGAKTGTICKHVGHILSKLNVENRTAAAMAAVETYRSRDEISASKPSASWAALAAAIAFQFADFCSDACEFFDVLPDFVA